MFYGILSPHRPQKEDRFTNRFEKILSEDIEGTHHQVTYGQFSGGFFLHPRLPYTIKDCMYLDREQDLLVVMSGCIYNRIEICKENGLNPKTVSDPSLVAFLYCHSGVRFVESLNGDFSIVIYRARPNSIFLFRDHLGIRPLAYALKKHSLYFSTDIIGLCRSFYNQQTDSINVDYLLSIYKTIDYRLTPHGRVIKLSPGHYLTSDSRGINTLKYWTPETIKTDNTLTQEQVFAELKSLLTDAVHIRSDQRFIAGAHVSGGLDSGVVASLVRKEYFRQDSFYGFSWSSSEVSPVGLDDDEREHVQKTCTMASITPVYVHLTLDDFIQLSKEYLNNQGYFQEEKILEMAGLHKINLIFSGWGGDEFISKGNRGIDSDLFFGFQWVDFFKRNPWNQPKKVLATLAYKVFFPAMGIVKSSHKTDTAQFRYVKKAFRKEHKKSVENFFFYHSRRTLQLGMLYNYHLPERMESWFTNGFKHGVEYRYPLLDKRIVEYMLKVPSRHLVSGKYARIVLREIAGGLLPEEVRWRKSKYDSVFFGFMEENYVAAGRFFKTELKTIKNNPHLYFFDFDLLENELCLYEKKEDKEALKKVYTDILAIKLIHEFTKRYTKEHVG